MIFRTSKAGICIRSLEATPSLRSRRPSTEKRPETPRLYKYSTASPASRKKKRTNLHVLRFQGAQWIRRYQVVELTQ